MTGGKFRKLAILLVGLILVAVLFYTQIVGKFEPKVSSIQPANGAKDVNVRSVIEASFQGSVPQDEQQKIFVQIVPGTQTINEWTSPNTLRIVPQGNLLPSTNYTISISYEDTEIHRSSFETQFLKVYTEEEIQEIANMALEVSAGFYEVAETYPFMEDLPITRDNYTVVFDFDLQQFRIRLKMPSTAPEETKQEAINSALAEMTSLGIDVEAYGYHILYSD